MNSPDRTTPPPEKEIPVDRLEIPVPRPINLSNHIPVYALNTGVQEVVQLEWILKAGLWYENKDEDYLSYFTTKMLPEGTASYSANEISEKLAKYGADFEVKAGPDWLTISLSVMTKFLPEVFPLLQELILYPVFPDQEWEHFKQVSHQNLQIKQNKTDYLASNTFKETLFGKNHPYGKKFTSEIIESYSSNHLKTFHQQHFLPDNCFIIISGRFDHNNTINLLENYFGNSKWEYQNKTNQNDNQYQNLIPSQYQQNPLVINQPEKVQSSIRTGKRMITRHHPDFYYVKIANTLLGGFFGSRLMKKIREEKGYTYGIMSQISTLQHDGYWVIGADVRKAYTQATLDEISKEIDNLKAQEAETEEIEVLKNYMQGAILNSFNTPFDIADKVKMLLKEGLSANYYQDYLKTIKTITAAEIRETFVKHLNQNNMLQVVAGGFQEE